ncbi:hypothetical protein LY76DRAFT_258887 [Colletotrichum caudatum]|nr:hypothetical protein LY76DRAFT_258887 [Colletotrichum caudatum]
MANPTWFGWIVLVCCSSVGFFQVCKASFEMPALTSTNPACKGMAKLSGAGGVLDNNNNAFFSRCAEKRLHSIRMLTFACCCYTTESGVGYEREMFIILQSDHSYRFRPLVPKGRTNEKEDGISTVKQLSMWFLFE